ncbi:MAG: IS30 family transposase [Treponema sp.]|nr:IS30 family transposase [Treponema sp.]
MEKNKHLTAEDRKIIEVSLDHNKSYAGIARDLGKDPTTISKEVKAHAVIKRTGAFRKHNYNNCKHQFCCKKSAICTRCVSPQRHNLCRNCSICNQHCSDYEAIVCSRRKKAKHVCNGCGFIDDCNFEKRFYNASKAQQEYRSLLSESRSGIGFTQEELKYLDDTVSALVAQGQSPYHISECNRDTLMVSKNTIYRLIDSGLISARNLDLPRKVRYKARKKKKSAFKVDRSCRVGRDYNCFRHFMDENPDTPITQLDSVIGKKGGKVLLTIHFFNCDMMLAFLRDRIDAKSVQNIFESLYRTLGHDRFSNVFQLCLADNGSEFSDPAHIEFAPDGSRRTRVFFCNPQAPYQKGSAERNHEFIRCFIPKGTDIGQYTQDDITRMMNHINSYKRVSLGNKCPYDVFRFLYGSDLLELLGCTTIPAQQVNLNKSVFRKGEAV